MYRIHSDTVQPSVDFFYVHTYNAFCVGFTVWVDGGECEEIGVCDGASFYCVGDLVSH